MKKHILRRINELRKTHFKIDLFKLVIVVVALAIAFALLYRPVLSLFDVEHRHLYKASIDEMGFPAHVIYILVVAVQVLLSFIPATGSITIFGGFAFDPVLGTLYTMIGLMIGSTIALYLGRRYGRPLLEDLMDPKMLEKFDEKSEQKGLVTLLLIYLIPFTPDNATCLLAGTTRMRIRNMVIVSAIGRFPSTLLSTMIGAGLGGKFSASIIITITVLALLIGLAYAKRDELEDKLKHVFK